MNKVVTGTHLWTTPHPILTSALAARRCYSIEPIASVVQEIQEKDFSSIDRLLKRVVREKALDVFEHVHSYLLIKYLDISYVPSLLESYLKFSTLDDSYYLISGNLRAFYNYNNEVIFSIWPKSDILKSIFWNWLKYPMPYLFPLEDDARLECSNNGFSEISYKTANVSLLWRTDINKINDILPHHLPAFLREKHMAIMIGIDNISRIMTHQLVRHREFSFDMSSQRFSSAAKENFITPPSIKANKQAFQFYHIATENSLRNFDILRNEYKVPKEDARFVVPSGIGTKLVMTGSVSAFKHLIVMRNVSDAQWEIRGISQQIEEIINFTN